MTRNQTSARLVTMLAAIGVLGVVTAGCSAATPPVAGARPPATTAPAPTRPTTTAPAPSATPSPAPQATPKPATPKPSPTTQPAANQGPPRCRTADLTGSLGPADAGAGSVFRSLILTNTGDRTCMLRGFPGVSYVAGDDGHQVGPAAARSGERGGSVRLVVGGSAAAPLQLVNVHNFDEAVCKPTPVRGLRVYPPGATASLFVPMDGTGCAGTPPGPQLFVKTLIGN